MDTFCYDEMAEFAEELISESGRTIQIIKFSETPNDTAQPWDGPTTPRTSPEATVTTFATFVHPTSDSLLGKGTISDDLKKRSEQICLISPGISTFTDDLATFTEIIDDDGTRWNIQGIETLRPGSKILLYFIGVKR